MKNSNRNSVSEPASGLSNLGDASNRQLAGEVRDLLSQILRAEAQKMLPALIWKEVDDSLQNRPGIGAEDGRWLVIPNASLPESELITGLGQIPLRQPRVRDKRPADEREVFNSSIRPKYLRSIKSIEELLPCPDLKGIRTNDFPEALLPLLDKDAKGFPATIRLTRSKLPLPQSAFAIERQTIIAVSKRRW